MAFDVFISYSHQDKELRNELEKHLSNLRRQQVINSWYDGDISPGSEWKQQIIAHINTAQIILLLVSADFMASDFCYSIEMMQAIARHDANQARVIPIILRPTDWKGAPFAKLNVLPTDGKPVTRWPTHDDAFEDIVQGIRVAVDDLIKRNELFADYDNAPIQQHLGKTRAELSTWLSQKWLKEGPPVCFVEGFSGVGKTSLARDLIQQSGWNAVMVNMPDAGSDQADNLFLDLATELSDNGFNEMANAVDSGASLSSALEGVLHKQVLIVIDEFQRALVDNTGRPISALERLLEKIANRPRLPGRLLLLSNRLVERAKWSEAYAIKTLSALETEAAELLLDKLLREANRSQDVPLARRREVVNWLGCNPRAMRVLVASLERDSLDELIGLNPDIWELRDREVSPELLERLERELLERTLSHLKAETNTLLRQLSVHRKSVKREAIEMLLPQGATFASIRDDLISRFLMEQHSGWFTLNPIAREISLQRLKANAAELQQAHSKAADHYMRHFTAKNIVGGGQLGGYFVEARYHLVQSKRETELSQITERFENHLKASFTLVSPVPKEANELNERIAVLSALLEIPGAKGLEYYLARLYEARGAPGDLPRALTYAQKATGPKAPAESWVLRIRLEGLLNGPERALQVCWEGIDLVPTDKGLVDLYQIGGDLLRQASRTDEAITLLKEGIARIPADKSLFSLYISCGELLAQAGRIEEAIILLKESIGRISADEGLSALYHSCAELLAQAGRTEEAITLLKEGVNQIPADKGLVALYQSSAGLLVHLGKATEAIVLLKTGESRISSRKKDHQLLVEYILLLYTATHNIAALENYLGKTSPGAIDPQQVAFGRVLRFQIQREWKLAAEAAHQGTIDFPVYSQLFIQEAFSWLCTGDAKAANEALEGLPRSIKIDKWSPFAWLKALVALKNDHQQAVRENLSLYLGRTLADQEEIHVNLLLGLWDTCPKPLEGFDLALYFPTLPPSFTGLPHDVTRLQYGPPVLHINASTIFNRDTSILKTHNEMQGQI